MHIGLKSVCPPLLLQPQRGQEGLQEKRWVLEVLGRRELGFQSLYYENLLRPLAGEGCDDRCFVREDWVEDFRAGQVEAGQANRDVVELVQERRRTAGAGVVSEHV